jgi:DNA-directed RNA polymerase omega subunit
MTNIQPIERLLPKAGDSIYRLVRMASNRALELSEGRKCLIDHPTNDKATTRALEEIQAGRVVFKDAKDHLAGSGQEVEVKNIEAVNSAQE